MNLSNLLNPSDSAPQVFENFCYAQPSACPARASSISLLLNADALESSYQPLPYQQSYSTPIPFFSRGSEPEFIGCSPPFDQQQTQLPMPTPIPSGSPMSLSESGVSCSPPLQHNPSSPPFQSCSPSSSPFQEAQFTEQFQNDLAVLKSKDGVRWFVLSQVADILERGPANIQRSLRAKRVFTKKATPEELLFLLESGIVRPVLSRATLVNFDQSKTYFQKEIQKLYRRKRCI
eukprot:TRINITY_DN3443_c0_g1_i1.p2 TRINITY_DN3443_c0_g1~~TRINITY_DN3443_c0_g1_i1.p2  ORF type:complete len:233 (+),score=103.33 TRINITY_DN3443_c0_g1_i1:98-796(+)